MHHCDSGRISPWRVTCLNCTACSLAPQLAPLSFPRYLLVLWHQISLLSSSQPAICNLRSYSSTKYPSIPSILCGTPTINMTTSGTSLPQFPVNAPNPLPTLSPGTVPKVEPPKPSFPIFSWRFKNPFAHLVYIRDSNHADLELSRLRGDILGFDLEWKPMFRRGQRENPVALVQLASQDTILLLQLTAMTSM
jgi:hypothetical protein